MIKFFCRSCGKELWQGLLRGLKRGETIDPTLNELWNELYCSDCIIAKYKKEQKDGG